MTLKLSTPIKRGDEVIETVWLTPPTAGVMRGLKLLDVAQMEVTAISALLARITNPALLPAEIAALPPADFMALATEVVGFFVPAEQMAAARQQLQ